MDTYENIIFLNTYSEEECKSNEELLYLAYEKYPFSITYPIAHWQEELHKEKPVYFYTFRRLLDFFEISTQYISSILISIIRETDSIEDPEIERIIRFIPSKELSFGDWVNDIFITLVKRCQIILPDNDLVNCLNKNLFEFNSFNILQGRNGKVSTDKHKSIVSLRNEYLAHDTTLSDDIYKNVSAVIETRLWTMLKAMQPLANVIPFVVDKAIKYNEEEKTYQIYLLKGKNESRHPILASFTFPLKKNSYYISRSEICPFFPVEKEDVLEISPLVIYYQSEEEIESEMFTYIFQTVAARKLSRLTYISPHEKAKKKETEIFKEDFFRLLFRFIKSLVLDGNNIISQKQSWEELQELIIYETNNYLSQMGKGKYSRDLFVDRKILSNLYQKFRESNKQLFPILGNAGIGKTNQLCYWAEDLIKERESIICMSGNEFSNETLESKFQKLFHSEKKKIEQLLDTLHEAAEKENKIVYFFFDALNECLEYKNGSGKGMGAVDLLCEINHHIAQEKYKHFKIILTCRNYTWEELIHKENQINHHGYFVLEDQKELSVKGFTEEELIEAYEKYRNKYNLKTDIEELLEDRYAFIRTRLSDPLILKMASINFKENFLPTEIIRFNTVNLFMLAIEELKKIKGGILMLQILDKLTEAMYEKKTDAIALTDLYAAYNDKESPLHKLSQLIFSNEYYDKSNELIQLIDNSLLRIIGYWEQLELQFMFERFYEFMLARFFIGKEKKLLPDRNIPIPATAYFKELERMGAGVAFMGAMRNALIMDYKSTGKDPGTLIDIAQSPIYEAYPLVADALLVMMNENYDDVYEILSYFIDFQKEEAEALEEINIKLCEIIEKGEKKYKISHNNSFEQIISKQKDIYSQLLSIIAVRKISTVLISEIFKSNIYQKKLYTETTDPQILLWKLMADPIGEVRDYVSLYIYYISRYNTTLGYSIINHLSQKALDKPLLSLVSSKNRQELIVNNLEPSIRIGLIMIIDGLVERKDYNLAKNILTIWKDIIKKYTLNHSIIKIAMPFFKFILRRQGTIQTDYVNNGIEYNHYWDEIPQNAEINKWGHVHFRELSKYLRQDTKEFNRYHSTIKEAYKTGDAFSYFLLERVLIVQGYKGWYNIKDIIIDVFTSYRENPYFSYSQMSMLYVLFQIQIRSEQYNPEIELLFNENCIDWAKRQKGTFPAHNHKLANKGKTYKQYVLNWYGVVYCQKNGDGMIKVGDERPVPLFFDLINYAFKRRDKELFYYCIENISVLVSDFGYYKTALLLFEYTLGLFKRQSDLYAFDQIIIERDEYKDDIRTFLLKMLGTIKNYFPREVDYFLNNKLKNSTFPNIEQYREDIAGYNQSSEGIGDLLTHKFGNFIIWSLLNDENIASFFEEGFSIGAEVEDYPSWLDGLLRIGFKMLFDIKI